MKDGKRYRISGWSVFALLVVPFAVVASIVVVAAMERPDLSDADGQTEKLQRFVAETVRKLGAIPNR